MSRYPTLDHLELELGRGQGVAIIVEGEGYEADPSFFRDWFGDRAKEVSFYPQDGWAQVKQAVHELRVRLHDQRVYGIIDRDFAETAELDAEFETQGILRTPRYTLENYLLESEPWAAALRTIFRRFPTELGEWGNATYVQNQIVEAYRQCLPLAAHNWVVKQAAARYALSREYLEHPQALQDDLQTILQNWGRTFNVSADLGDLYHQQLQTLTAAAFETWQIQVTGKAVLWSLHQRLPRRPQRGQLSLEDWLDRYMDQKPVTPIELAILIQRIITHSQATRSHLEDTHPKKPTPSPNLPCQLLSL